VNYPIDIPAAARKDVAELPGYIRAQARELIRALGSNPRPARARELRGKSGIYRVWLAGRWRIVYAVDDERHLVRILRVRLKETIDYESL
jgi:mRNA-degrading endonuclease RelE of RelBE toxin-antitoxin system